MTLIIVCLVQGGIISIQEQTYVSYVQITVHFVHKLNAYNVLLPLISTTVHALTVKPPLPIAYSAQTQQCVSIVR
jgi:hypothetical protein